MKKIFVLLFLSHLNSHINYEVFPENRVWKYSFLIKLDTCKVQKYGTFLRILVEAFLDFIFFAISFPRLIFFC